MIILITFFFLFSFVISLFYPPSIYLLGHSTANFSCHSNKSSCGSKQNIAEVVRLGKPAPAFESKAVFPDGSIGPIKSADYAGKWLVLFFYPLAATFVCATEIPAMSEKVADFKKINTEVVLCSVDSVFSQHAWTQIPINKGGIGQLKAPLMADMSHQIGKSYDCLLDAGHHSRATYIIDDKGIVRHITQNDPPVGRNIDEIYRLVEAYQFTDAHGEVCPANWKKGGKTIKPDVTKKLEYFESL